jgi:hypothetical protein
MQKDGKSFVIRRPTLVKDKETEHPFTALRLFASRKTTHIDATLFIVTVRAASGAV